MTMPVRFTFRALLLLLLAGFGMAAAQADGPTLTASFGIAGRYRPGAWCPVTVTVHNPSGEAFSGQIQVQAAPTPGRPGYGGAGGNASLGSALFARPVSVSGSGTQNFVVYVRGIDPGRDSVTVQLAQGQERGDGRVLARTDNEPNNSVSTVTGTPLTDDDFFLVGFAGEPGAFTYLSGQKLGVSHQPAGSAASIARIPPNPGVPPGTVQAASATAQVASTTAADLPDKAAGYSGVDAFLLRGDAPLDALTEAQEDALKGWVASGGHLIVFCSGTDPSPYAASFFTGLLPAGIGPAGSDGRLTLTPKPLAGVHAISQSPPVVTGAYGAGQVTVTNYNPAQSAALPPGAFWPSLFTAGHAYQPSLLAHVATREENYDTGYYGPDQTLLSDAVMRAPSLDAPGTEVIGLFLLVYLIALVPANYLILKRLDRKELAWVTIPLLVLVFAVGTFGVGYAAKGGAVFVNRAAIVETSAGQRDAGVYADVGLFSPHRTSYDIAVPGANGLAALPNPGYRYGYQSQGTGAEMQSGGQTKFVQSSEGTSLLDTSVNMWAMRAFDTQSTTDLGGTIDAALIPPSLMQSLGISGTITNHTNYDLTDCALLYHGQWKPLGALGREASLTVGSGPAVSANNQTYFFNIPTLPGEGSSDDTHGDIRQRMRWALASYVRSLGQQSGSNYYGNMQAPTAYAPSPNEAILIGWSDNPALAGPIPRIDGHSVHENDVELVVVHLPIGGR